MSNKVTIDQILAKIKNVQYTVLPDTTTTVCQLTLENGFTVLGTSSCVDPANFDEKIGQDIAMKNAQDKVWELEGYLLAEDILRNQPKPCLDFGDAIRALKSGKKVARSGWNGKGMWLAYSPGCKQLTADKFWAGPNKEYATLNGGYADVLPCITMKTASGEVLMGWLASQTDMLAEDWLIVE